MGDEMRYLSALDLTINVVFEDTSLSVAEQIKQHVFLIQEKLEQLVKLAKQVDGDEVIINKIHVFCSEVLFNFLSRFGDKRFTENDSVIKHARPKTDYPLLRRRGDPCGRSPL